MTNEILMSEYTMTIKGKVKSGVVLLQSWQSKQATLCNRYQAKKVFLPNAVISVWDLNKEMANVMQ